LLFIVALGGIIKSLPVVAVFNDLSLKRAWKLAKRVGYCTYISEHNDTSQLRLTLATPKIPLIVRDTAGAGFTKL